MYNRWNFRETSLFWVLRGGGDLQKGGGRWKSTFLTFLPSVILVIWEKILFFGCFVSNIQYNEEHFLYFFTLCYRCNFRENSLFGCWRGGALFWLFPPLLSSQFERKFTFFGFFVSNIDYNAENLLYFFTLYYWRNFRGNSVFLVLGGGVFTKKGAGKVPFRLFCPLL